MATPRSAWGIDIGNRALKAIKLTRSGDDLKIEDVEFIEHETVLSQAGDNREALINTAIANFASRRNVKGSVVAVGVAGSTSFARFIKLPPVEDKRLPEIVRFEAIQQIPFPLDEVEWSYQLFRQPDNPEVEVGIFAMRKELVNTYVKYFTDVDLNVQVVQMNPLAVYNAMQRDGRFAEGICMVVDVGADNTDLLIAGDESVWHRSIPIGGNSFTETLMKAFKVPFAKAEELKRTAATSKYQRQIFSAMRPIFADLVAEIQRSIGFYGSVNRDQKIQKVYAIGGTTKLTPLQKYMQQNLQMDVEKIEAFGSAVPTESKAAGELIEHLPSLHSAYGLALQAMGQGKIVSSLLPSAIRREKMWQEKTKWFAAAAAVAAVAALVPVGRLMLDRAAFAGNETMRRDSAIVLSDAKSLDGKWRELESVGGTETAVIKNVMGLVEHRAVWADIIAELTGAVPKPDAALAKAITDRAADAVKKTPRNQRQIFRIESVRSRYLTDVGPILRDPGTISRHLGELTGSPTAAPTFGRGGFAPSSGYAGGPPQNFSPPGFEGEGGGVPSAAPPTEGLVSVDAAGQRGFLVRVRIISPFRGADQLLAQQFIAALNKVAPSAATPARLYAFQKAEVTRSATLRNDPELLRRLEADFAASKAADIALMPTGGAGGVSPGGFGTGGFGGGNPGWRPGMPPPGFDFQAGEGGPVGDEMSGFGNQPPQLLPPGVPAGEDAGDTDPEDPTAQAFKDNLTGEDVRLDQVVEVLFVVVLDPPRFVPPVPVEGATPAQ